ncbi:MAG: cation-translocating P-type ATPase [Christensenellaceae bacterium]|nr:cation-translocating P-type ATPase [Christensenellaceae bacterium]
MEQVLAEQGSAPEGLGEQEAAKRLVKYGSNALAEAEKEGLVKRFLKQLADPMIFILLAAAAVSGATAAYAGESFADVFIILAVVLINAVLGLMQESKAEQAIEALNKISAPTAKVMRGGHLMTVGTSDLVPGDVLVLEAGDAIGADGRLIECASLKVEEAALTGESVPVGKDTDALAGEGGRDVPLGDRRNMVYMGSTIAYGRGRAVVTATGMNTEVGKIAGALAQAEEGKTPLQRKLSQLSRALSFLVLGICAAIFVVDVVRMGGNVTGERLLRTFMVAVSLAVAAIPEGLAAVVTIVLSIGVTNMSRRGAIIRKLTAVETLGCAQVICSDKTGTLTQNVMTVVEQSGADERLLATAMALASDARLEAGQAVGEPTECALVNCAAKLGLDKGRLEEATPRVGEAPFDSMRKMMTTLHRAKDGHIAQYTKGAPDEVLKRSTFMLSGGARVELTDALRDRIMAENKRMADKALRVLCAATRDWDEMPDNLEPEALENSLCYLGLSGMIDPVRPEVGSAIVKCRTAGIRPVMITGDHRDTAVAIARELGMLQDDREAITGAQLDDIPEAELPEAVSQLRVYARVQPEHKVRIVNAWRNQGKVVAMTGDGVNDAPSIKAADIGVGMGITGTDVTKNVADMVLSDDNFATIVKAVEEGRRIYDNIRKSVQFLLASNLSEVLAIFAATLMGFIILEPAHLLWINLITDSFPALALGMEKAEDGIMKRPPRDPSEGIFAGGVGASVLLQGTLVTLITLAAYFIGHFIEAGEWAMVNSHDGTTMAFLALSMTEIFHAFNMRRVNESIFRMKHQNKFLWAAMGASLVMTTAVIYVPFLRAAFGFAHISPMEYAISMLLAISIIPMVEFEKWIRRKLAR